MVKASGVWILWTNMIQVRHGMFFPPPQISRSMLLDDRCTCMCEMQVVDFVVIHLAILWLIMVFSMLDMANGSVFIMQNNVSVLKLIHSNLCNVPLCNVTPLCLEALRNRCALFKSPSLLSCVLPMYHGF
jgi:hypothetical protein